MSIVKELLEKKGVKAVVEEARKVAREYSYKLRKEGRISFSEPAEGQIPSIHIARRTLPEVWEDTTMALLGIGNAVHTHYDPTSKGGNYTSFPSLEGTVMMRIDEPFGEPRFHKHYLGGWLGMGDYKAEIEGVKDGWMISPKDVAQKLKTGKFKEIRSDKRWNYTYSQRMRAYHYFDCKGDLKTVNQLEQVVKSLKREPTCKSAQCITWDPRWDHNDGQMDGSIWEHYHSPCLQRFWFRLVPIKTGYRLHVNAHWRSRDHLKAVPSNIFGITEGMHEYVRLRAQEEIGVTIERGPYTDISDSLHIYGHYFDPAVGGLDAESYLEDVFRIASGEPISERVIAPGSDMYDVMMEEIEREYQFRTQNPNYGNETPGA